MIDKLTQASFKQTLIKRGWTLEIDRPFTTILEKDETLIELGATSSYTIDTENSKFIASYEKTEIRGNKLLVLDVLSQYQCLIGDEQIERKAKTKKEVKK